MRRLKRSLFFLNMDLQKKIKSLLEEILKKNSSLFLIDIQISNTNNIRIILDGDNGVSLKDCVNVSREIEFQLDRNEVDFSLEVTSFGVGTPLKDKRQYYNNIGRKLEVELSDKKFFQGTLVSVDEKSFLLNWKQREQKLVGKGKVTVKKEKKMFYDNIVNAKVLI